MNMRGLLALGVLCATCGWIWAADEIIVTVRQGSFGPESEVGRFDSGEAINLTTAQLEAAAGTANFDFVRIYDSSANPSSEPFPQCPTDRSPSRTEVFCAQRASCVLHR
jgi:hypothetical protein